MTIRIRVSLAIVLCLASVVFAQSGEYEHEFVYKPDGNVSHVSVAGDFNNWSADASPMKLEGDTWRAKLKLPEGVQHYKFVVDGNKWISDPGGDKSLESDDNYGGKNSGVFIGPDGRNLPPAQPNDIRIDAVKHDPADPRDRDVVSKNLLMLAIRTQADDVQQVVAQVHDGAQTKSVPLARISSKYGFDRFGATTETTSPSVSYQFELTDGSKGAIYPATALSVEMKPAFETPDWAKHAIWYQIFPERFRNGDPANDPNDHDYEHVVKWTSDWWKAQPGEEPGDENFYKGKGNVWKRRYGGDVQGLIQALPYLRKLGINAIYLNPMFEADSMHKYDTTDYRHIDDNFGFKGDIAALQGETDDPATWQWTKTDKLFLDFVAQAHAMGFKVILDGVFNHVGRSHWAFQDVLKNGKSSKYAGWFDVRDWTPPIKYIAWDRGADATSDGALPILKKDPELGLVHGPREHIFAITKRWLAPDGDASKGVDGFRLDVPGDIPHPFWVDWRKVVKGAKPDAYISGEIWTWAQPWLKGDQFDAVMNYRWADAAQKFFVNQKLAIRPSEFNQYLNEIAYNYPFQSSLVQMNLFDSHDTDRFASMFVNPDLAYDAANRIQDNGPKYKPDKPTPEMWTRMEQAALASMTFVGAPMIYYGDEAGMWSPDDPSNRQPMVWPEMTFDNPEVKFNPELFAFYQRAIAIREKLPQLQLGFFRGVTMDDAGGVYVFERELGDSRAWVVLNRSGDERMIPVTMPAGVKTVVDWLDPSQADVVVSDSARPAIQLKPSAGIKVENGTTMITLKPFTSAVLMKQ